MNEDEKDDRVMNNKEEKKEEEKDADEDSDLAFLNNFNDVIDLARLLDDDEEYIAVVDQFLDNLMYSDDTVSAVLSELGASLFRMIKARSVGAPSIQGNCRSG